MQRPGQRPSDHVFPRATEEHFQDKSRFIPVPTRRRSRARRFYTCRHTFCSWLAMAGASVKEIQEAAGHKTITMSARYAHHSPEHTQSVVGQNRHYPANSPQNQPPGERRNPENVVQTSLWCPEGDLNPHGGLAPADFKSAASASFAIRARWDYRI